MPIQSPQWNATARMLRRAGFGTSGPAVDAAVEQDWPTQVAQALAVDPDADQGARATPMPSLDPPTPPGKAAPRSAHQQYNAALGEQTSQLSQWWMRRMVSVDEPIHEKLTLLWHNHFATSAAKVRMAAWMGAQNQKLRTLKLGDFRTLAYSMLTDAAMMQWLDGQTNTAKSANENLAREFMELFALGHGNGYTESDVRNGARALTGWVLGDGDPRLVPGRHDSSGKSFLGATGNLDAAGFCDAVLAQPASAGYITGRLWQQLASQTAPSAAALARLLGAYGPGRDLYALTQAILTDEEFITARPGLVNTPVEWLVGVARSLRVPMDDKRVKTSVAALKTLGQQPFYPPDVGGWPRGQVWLSTVSAGVRMSTAATLAAAGDLSPIEQAVASDRIDAVGYLIGIGDWTDRSVKALKPLTGKPPMLVAAAVNTPEYLTS
ncbi:DUF1800 domain-containing protein [Mycolicibacterium komossense]|uniref:DUF1800 family protein n=1 Tax=Mycolicibacterium komossense TaxID=1779 RepID=A0ABT3CFM6_9MYCO|nr:DUF1800 domain-containing protein [Mycolicibacterium komossense]MCV7228221.1 DUF1800 family protein [Mycolicibacterium komossense]